MVVHPSHERLARGAFVVFHDANRRVVSRQWRGEISHHTARVAAVVATRAIRIEAPAAAVWLWPTRVARLGMLPMEPASLVMERKMLRGIKPRSERLAGL
jgi:hypothetical protein